VTSAQLKLRAITGLEITVQLVDQGRDDGSKFHGVGTYSVCLMMMMMKLQGAASSVRQLKHLDEIGI
jgi:hypothetical protein